MTEQELNQAQDAVTYQVIEEFRKLRVKLRGAEQAKPKIPEDYAYLVSHVESILENLALNHSIIQSLTDRIERLERERVNRR